VPDPLATEQLEQCALLGVIGLRRIARRRTDAAILFADQFLRGQRLVARITPELLAHALMHALRKSLREAVRQRLDHDG